MNMDMKRFYTAIVMCMIVASCLWAKDDEVIVTRQLTTSQRNALPEKTITVEMKRLQQAKKANQSLIDAITLIMDTIASEDYQNRTFVMLLEPRADGQVAIAIRSDDIVTRGKEHQDNYYGALEHRRYHFVVLTSNDNATLLQETFKRHDKVKFVQEFEFVDFKTPNYPTNVIGIWAPAQGLTWQSVAINDDPYSPHEVQPHE